MALKGKIDRFGGKGYGFVVLENGEKLFITLRARRKVTSGENGVYFTADRKKGWPTYGQEIVCERVPSTTGPLDQAFPWATLEEWEAAEKPPPPSAS